MLSRVKKTIDSILGRAVAVLMAFLVFDVVWQVFSRYVLQDPSSFTDELARFLLIWVALLGAAYVTGQRMHLAIDLLPAKVNAAWLERLIYSLVGLFALLALVIGGIRLVNITLTLNQSSSALQLPLGYVYLALPISGMLIFFYALVEMIQPKKHHN
ncbi:MAG: TRAP transporter small permease [Cyclobacteriaceae bacterium]|nr:TRAP transporter small permease [Cyclobacteriaceae bacterium HetDA_MAG_MS6]